MSISPVRISFFKQFNEAGIGLAYDEAGEFVHPSNAKLHSPSTVAASDWPAAIHLVEEFAANLRAMWPGWRVTLTQAYDENTRDYIPTQPDTFWYQVICQKDGADTGTRTHMIRLHEGEVHHG